MQPIQVIIKERQVEYLSDYPDGWRFSAGDPFKSPVLLSNYPCFIKRFEQKSPEDISGWELLTKIAGVYERTLSRVYDIKNVQEDEREIYYVFYEHLDGVTLDKYLREPDINLLHLNNDLFNAIRALHKYGFWFADFTEKNIFCQKDGTFILVDVDSTQRISDLPDNEMYGSKDYWILVLKFYKEILNKNDIRLADINGINLNYLQIPFLILRLKLFLSGNRDDYNSTELFNQLPSRLNKMVPEFRDIYLNVFKNGKDPLSKEEISKIEDIVERRIIKIDDMPDVAVAPVSLPVIKTFRTSNSAIQSGGTFTLSWQVENANKLELYKNGAKFKELDISQKEVMLKEFADGTRQQSSYHLIAYKDLNMAKSDPVTIKLEEDAEPKKVNVKKIVGILAGLIALAAISFFLYKYFNNQDSDEASIKQYVLRQGVDSTITIYGKSFPSKDKIIILFNETEAKIETAYKDSLVVHLPSIKFTDSHDAAFVTVNFNDKRYKAGSFMYLHAPEMEQTDLFEDSIISFSGQNLNTDHIKVLLENKEIPVLIQTENGLTGKVPVLQDTTEGRFVQLLVTEDNRTIFSRNFSVTYDKVDLLALAFQANWVGAQLLPDGNNTTSGINLPWPGGQSDSRGFAILSDAVMEDANSYFALRTHPMWVPQGTIKGFFPWVTLKGKKIFKSEIGFLQDGRSTDGAEFQVWVHYHVNQAQTFNRIIKEFKAYSGSLTNISAEFPPQTSADFFIELRVDAGNSPNSDWAAWIKPMVISRRLAAQ